MLTLKKKKGKRNLAQHTLWAFLGGYNFARQAPQMLRRCLGLRRPQNVEPNASLPFTDYPVWVFVMATENRGRKCGVPLSL